MDLAPELCAPDDDVATGAAEPARRPRVCPAKQAKGHPMKGALAWLIGIPIPIIILLYVFDVF